MSGAVLEPTKHWLLLDVQDAPLALGVIRSSFADSRRFRLFEGTEFQPVCDQGPLLVELAQGSALESLCHSDPQTWRGLLLVCEVQSQELLSHLRRMLTVSFGLHHRALLGYYNRQTASYFFDACDARDLSRWLGPIRQLRWFGGTWADRALGSLGWQQLHNPQLVVTPLGVEESLTERQCERLQTCLLEQHAWRWSQSVSVDYGRLWSHIQEGLALGFSAPGVMDGWLWLRLQHPHATFGTMPAGLDQQARLERLRRRWQGPAP